MVRTCRVWMHGIMSVVYLGLLLAICTPFGLAVWVASRHKPSAPMSQEAILDGLGEFPPARVSFAAETLDVEPAVRAAADALLPLAHANSVQMQLAVSQLIKVRVDPDALRFALRATIHTAIRATPGGQVLVTAVVNGGRLHIRIVDDGTGADQNSRESLAREASDLIALQGGSIMIEARRGRGTTVTMRLPLPTGPAEEEETPALVEAPDLASQTA
jgi:signal transduction histidine kinase